MKREVILATYKKMIKETFNYKGKSSRMEFFIPVMIHILTFIILYVIKCIPYEIISNLSLFISQIFAIYSFITLFPLSFRRLHDAGHKATLLIVYIVFSLTYILFLMIFLFNSLIWAFTFGILKFHSEILIIILNVLSLIQLILGIILIIFLFQPSKKEITMQ